MYRKMFNLRTLNQLWVRLPCQHRHLGSVHVDTGKLGQMSKGNMRRLETLKTKIFERKKRRKKRRRKTHLLLRLLAVLSRDGPHLTTVMIFVTQNNFKNGPGISDHLLGFYRTEENVVTHLHWATLCRLLVGQPLQTWAAERVEARQ